MILSCSFQTGKKKIGLRKIKIKFIGHLFNGVIISKSKWAVIIFIMSEDTLPHKTRFWYATTFYCMVISKPNLHDRERPRWGSLPEYIEKAAIKIWAWPVYIRDWSIFCGANIALLDGLTELEFGGVMREDTVNNMHCSLCFRGAGWP